MIHGNSSRGASRWLRYAFGIFLLCLIGMVPGANAQGRKALLIGNADYRGIGTLRTPARDAAALDETLRKLRFETTLVQNATLEGMSAAIDKFEKSLRPGDAAFFYFAGYSVQSTDENYLLPVNFDIAQNKELDYVAYSVSRILSDLEARKPFFLAFLLDAAWDHPNLRRRFPDAGFARLEPRAQGVFVGFSAGTGRPNFDDRKGAMSLYASAVVAALSQQGLTLSQIAETVKRTVSTNSDGRQIPTEASTVIQDFYVNPKPADVLAWEKLKDSQDVNALEQFRNGYPSSPFAAEAAARLEDIEWASARSKGRAGLERYLSRHSSGKYAATARRDLDALSQSQQPAQPDRTHGPDPHVLDVLKRYKDAMENRDMDALMKVWPTLTKAQTNTFKSFFRDARSIRIDALPTIPPETAGEFTTVRVKRGIQYNGMAPVNDTIVLKMRRTGDTLVIESASVER